MSKAKKIDTGLAVVNPKELDENLKNALKIIDDKLAALGSGTVPFTAKSTGNFVFVESVSTGAINILTSTDLNFLLKALAKMRSLKKEHTELAAELGIEMYPVLTWQGIGVDNWIHDLEHRAKFVANSAKINELNRAKLDLQGFLSQEDRLKETLSRTASLLSQK